MAEITRVVVPVDFSHNTDKIVTYGVSIADKLGAKVLFFHVTNDFTGYELPHPAVFGMIKDLKKESEKKMANLVKEHEQRENSVSGNVIVGDAADEIINYAKLQQADMIIIGTHGTKGLERVLMGSTADRVVKKAPCPVLVFNPFI